MITENETTKENTVQKNTSKKRVADRNTAENCASHNANTHAIAITNEADTPKKPNISVIVPVYNTAPYLKKCLDSLLSQSHSGLEIICINDASHDDSLDILETYAKKDACIRIYSFEQNVGVATCRNFALSKAQGEYISFVDSDDWIALDFYEKLYKQAKNGDYDIVKGGVYLAHEDGTYALSSYNSKIANALNRGKALAMADRDEFWTHLYRNTFLQSIHAQFPKLINGEDTVFLFSVLLHNPTFLIVEGAFYYYRQRQGSAHQTYSMLNAHSIFCAHEIQSALLDEAPLSQVEYMELYSVCIYESLLTYYKYTVLMKLPRHEHILCLQRMIDIIKKCKYLDVLCEFSTHSYLKKFLRAGSITQADIPSFLKEIHTGKRNFMFSYYKFWLRYKLHKGEKKFYYQRQYLLCKKIIQIERALAHEPTAPYNG